MTSNPHAGQPVLQQGPPPSEADIVFVLLHGRGGTAQDIIGLGQTLGGERASCLAPQAGGNTWYPQSFMAPRLENEPNLSYAQDKVAAVVAEAGVPTDKIVLCGFSQGACLACEFLAMHPARYRGLISFTGGLIGPPGMRFGHTGDLAGTPVFLAGGDPDPHVPFNRVVSTADAFKRMGATVRVERYAGRPHSISEAEIVVARQVLGLA